MKKALMRCKPGVGRQTHLLLAALLWTLVGIGLIGRGILWLQEENAFWLLVPALLIGTVKSRLILDRAADKLIARILLFSDKTCLGAVYSWKSWLLVLLMIGMGVLLRRLSSLHLLLGVLYPAIGWGLLASSRLAWRAWAVEHGRC